VEISDDDIHPGLIDNDTGAVNIICYPTVVLLRPFKNEVLDAVVTSASHEVGFHCHVGPLEIFVSRHSMPEDMRFNHATGDCWTSEDGVTEIKEGSVVRLRIIGTSAPEERTLSATGTIRENFLGQVS
jgi:DNA-directed RNA polymerase II subunit RPB7